MSEIAFLRPQDASAIRPQSVEAEQMVLGALLLDTAMLGRVVRAGGEGLFSDPVHAAIFQAILEKDKAGALVSPVTIGQTFAGNDAVQDLGGGRYIARLAGAGCVSSAVPGMVSMLADLSRKRSIVAAISEATAAIARGDETSTSIAARLESSLIGLSIGDTSGPVSMLKAVTIAVDQAMAAYSGSTDVFVRTGIGALDKMLSGFYPGELILMGGRPSMGKTGVALSIALNAARAGHGVAIASLEMNPEAMALRAISEATAQAGVGVAYSDMRRGQFDATTALRVIETAQDVGQLPITFLPRQFSDIGALLAGAKQAHRVMDGGMRLLVVDYAQLLRSQAKSRYEQITEISIALKALAGQLNVPVLALSQLSRAVEQRDDKRPVLSDLRESGQLEQDADSVLFCYRDEYYTEREKPPAEDIEAYAAWQSAMEIQKNRLEIIVAKQRQGEIGTAHVRFNPATNIVWEDRVGGYR